MKCLKSLVLAVAVLSVSATSPFAVASEEGDGEGYYYTVSHYTGVYPNPYQYMRIGPFAEESECTIARQADFDDDDTWVPLANAGHNCFWVSARDVSAYEDILDLWNSPVAGGGNRPGEVTTEKLETISGLRDEYRIDRYKAEVKVILEAR